MGGSGNETKRWTARGAWLVSVMLAACASSDTSSGAPASDAGVQQDVATNRDVVSRDTSADDASSPDGFAPDGAPDGGVVDDSTPCRDFGSLPFGVSFTPGASRLLITSPLGASVLATADWSVQRTLAGHRGPISGAAISDDGARGASIGGDDWLRMWDAVTGHQVAETTVTNRWPFGS